AAVGRDLHRDVGRRQGVDLRGCRGRQPERDHERRADEGRSQARAQLVCAGGGVPAGCGAVNWARGASRIPSSGSKYSRERKMKRPATTFVGTVWSALSYVSTVSL